MARIREFNPDEALDKAMNVFWQKGYSNTSIEDLVNATGVNRFGLYGEFGSKHGLLLAALDHYQNVVAGELFWIVERPGASLSGIRDYFAKLVELSSSKNGKLGCLMANCASEVAPNDKCAANKVETFRARLQLGFSNALSNAKTTGELSALVDVEPMADFLTGIMQGLSVLARSHANPKMMANMVEVALSHLQ